MDNVVVIDELDNISNQNQDIYEEINNLKSMISNIEYNIERTSNYAKNCYWFSECPEGIEDEDVNTTNFYLKYNNYLTDFYFDPANGQKSAYFELECSGNYFIAIRKLGSYLLIGSFYLKKVLNNGIEVNCCVCNAASTSNFSNSGVSLNSKSVYLTKGLYYIFCDNTAIRNAERYDISFDFYNSINKSTANFDLGFNTYKSNAIKI